jgi:hypothetical protein
MASLAARKRARLCERRTARRRRGDADAGCSAGLAVGRCSSRSVGGGDWLAASARARGGLGVGTYPALAPGKS